jgi:hypothetical protein
LTNAVVSDGVDAVFPSRPVQIVQFAPTRLPVVRFPDNWPAVRLLTSMLDVLALRGLNIRPGLHPASNNKRHSLLPRTGMVARSPGTIPLAGANFISRRIKKPNKKPRLHYWNRGSPSFVVALLPDDQSRKTLGNKKLWSVCQLGDPEFRDGRRGFAPLSIY